MVLVILAILAAILVPALLGWIDKAREKQYVLDARSVYVATQAAVDEYYAKNNAVPTNLNVLYDNIKAMADTDFTSITIDNWAGRVGGATVQAEISEMTIRGLVSGSANVNMQLTTADGWKQIS